MAASLLHGLIPLPPLFLLPCWTLKIELRDVLDSRSTVELHLSPTDVDSSISLHGPPVPIPSQVNLCDCGKGFTSMLHLNGTYLLGRNGIDFLKCVYVYYYENSGCAHIG